MVVAGLTLTMCPDWSDSADFTSTAVMSSLALCSGIARSSFMPYWKATCMGSSSSPLKMSARKPPICRIEVFPHRIHGTVETRGRCCLAVMPQWCMFGKYRHLTKSLLWGKSCTPTIPRSLNAGCVFSVTTYRATLAGVAQRLEIGLTLQVRQ